eukprot:7771709-Pyramimonas_sp.AAC.1
MIISRRLGTAAFDDDNYLETGLSGRAAAYPIAAGNLLCWRCSRHAGGSGMPTSRFRSRTGMRLGPSMPSVGSTGSRAQVADCRPLTGPFSRSSSPTYASPSRPLMASSSSPRRREAPWAAA